MKQRIRILAIMTLLACLVSPVLQGGITFSIDGYSPGDIIHYVGVAPGYLLSWPSVSEGLISGVIPPGAFFSGDITPLVFVPGDITTVVFVPGDITPIVFAPGGSISLPVSIDDGLSHTIDDDTYQNNSVQIDYNLANDPGTTVNIVEGGSARAVSAYNNASITISGGSVQSLNAQDNATITMSGGTILTVNTIINNGFEPVVSGLPFVNYPGTFINDPIFTFIINGSISTHGNGSIFLDGTDFHVDDFLLENGDKLSNFATLVEYRPGGDIRDYYTGTITGILADGSALDTQFKIYNSGIYEGTGDIIIIPEPCSLILLGLGGLVLRRRKA